MRLNDSYLRCIVYFGWPIVGTSDQLDPEGTGFFVEHEGAHYIVTAAHVARKFRDAPFGIRLNTLADGQGRIEHFDSVKWHEHPDDRVDVAVLPFSPPSWARANAFPTKAVLSEFKKQTKDIGPGDMVYIVGIFKLLPGSKRNNPVVHVGHLASWAEGEAISTLDWRVNSDNPPELKINGYLVQVHTMPQASGSPVFVRRYVKTVVTPKGSDSSVNAWQYGSVWLLGLWHGAWTDDLSKMLKLPQGSVNLGMGMGIAIPAPRIMETLNVPELVAMRQAANKSQLRGPIVIPQSKSRSGTTIRKK